MSLLFRIAVRNLLEHRGKTFIIGILVALGVVVLVVGNSMMDTARRGIQRAFIDNYTGDIMISGTAESPISLFGVQSVGGIDPTPVLPDYDQISEFVDSQPQISQWTTQITGFGLLRPEDPRIEGIENSAPSVLFGTAPESYQETFRNIEIVEGRYLLPGEEGIMLTTDRLEELQEEALESLAEVEIEQDEYPLGVGDEVRIIGLTADGLPRIRVVPIIAVYEITGISEGVGFEFVSYVDAQTLRAILRLNLGGTSVVDLDESETELLDRSGSDSAFDTDSLFSDDLFSEPEGGDAEGDVDFNDLDAMLGIDPEGEDAPNEESASVADEQQQAAESNTWNYILARVDPPRAAEEVIDELNAFFAENAIPAEAGNWEVAAGPFATSADVIRTVFNVAIIVIGIVAIIIMMNTLVISVMERTSEIGTMRALGAQRGLVWQMFMYEIVTITTVFGAAGVGLSLATIGILNAIGIPATNTFLTVLFAGPELRPVASVWSVISSLFIVTLVGLAAHVYPVAVALRVEPIKAIQTE
jgi:putative ABC transport system permease protein